MLPNDIQIPAWMLEDAKRVMSHGIVGWSGDLQSLADAAEPAERRADACVGRTIITAIPHEICAPDRECLVRDFAAALHARNKQAVVFALHSPPSAGDQRNWHAHYFVTEREVVSGRFSTRKPHEAYDRAAGSATVIARRIDWEHMANSALVRSGSESRVSCASYAAQGVPLQPTIHVGSRGTQLSRRGYQSHHQTKNIEITNEDKHITHTLRDACSIAIDLAKHSRGACQRSSHRVRSRGLAADLITRVPQSLGNQRDSTSSGRVTTDTRSGQLDATRERNAQATSTPTRNLTMHHLTQVAVLCDLRTIAGAMGWVIDGNAVQGDQTAMRRRDGSCAISVRQLADRTWVYTRIDGKRGGNVADLIRQYERLVGPSAKERLYDLLCDDHPLPEVVYFRRKGDKPGDQFPASKNREYKESAPGDSTILEG